nr:MAG TPA: hypothetical protein [Caudoviricetes sp.]
MRGVKILYFSIFEKNWQKWKMGQKTPPKTPSDLRLPLFYHFLPVSGKNW